MAETIRVHRSSLALAADLSALLLACQCDDARLDHDVVTEVRVLDAAKPARTARDAIPTYSERAGALLRRVPDTAEVL